MNKENKTTKEEIEFNPFNEGIITNKKPYYKKVKCYETLILDYVETTIIEIQIPVDIERKLAEAEISKGVSQSDSIVTALSEYLEYRDYDVPELLKFISKKEDEIEKLKKVINSIYIISNKNCKNEEENY